MLLHISKIKSQNVWDLFLIWKSRSQQQIFNNSQRKAGNIKQDLSAFWFPGEIFKKQTIAQNSVCVRERENEREQKTIQ